MCYFLVHYVNYPPLMAQSNKYNQFQLIISAVPSRCCVSVWEIMNTAHTTESIAFILIPKISNFQFVTQQ